MLSEGNDRNKATPDFDATSSTRRDSRCLQRNERETNTSPNPVQRSMLSMNVFAFVIRKHRRHEWQQEGIHTI